MTTERRRRPICTPEPEGMDEPYGGLKVHNMDRPNGKYELHAMRWGAERFHSPELMWPYDMVMSDPELRQSRIAELRRAIDEIARNFD